MGIPHKKQNKRLKPFLSWAGGKRWFVNNHADLLPRSYDKYIEPFLGSGAVFFYLRPKQAILGDSNTELIETYRTLKDDWKLVDRYLKEHHRKHSNDYYYRMRSFSPRSFASRAARFIYLNRTCWNGLYRVNLKGNFNVPVGTKTSVIFKDDCFEKVSKALQGVEFQATDFEVIIDRATKGDLVFVDPPYTVRHNNNAFIKYNEKLFSWSDQVRLFKALKRAKNRGAKIIGTNAYHRSIINMYKQSFKTRSLSRISLISSKAESRKKFKELIISTEFHNE